ncbi:MAG: NAD-dependent epimerase/dehydratase family protein [Sandaracinus sp.]|nr:NAD-dependent epimerase/dehydratase family protein [Sandaracinus sp.]
MRVAIAGATGFVGRALCEALVGEHRVVGLTRGASNDRRDGVEWRTCDLYSLLQLERALEGCDVALYLVHSMLAAVHDFRPALPWFVYALTQANVHAWVMNRFGRHLARVRPARGSSFRVEQASP